MPVVEGRYDDLCTGVDRLDLRFPVAGVVVVV